MKFDHTIKIGSFEPGKNHGPKGRKHAQAAAKALLAYTAPDGRIPEQLKHEAAKAASTATGSKWCSQRCLCLANQMRLTLPLR